MPWLWDLVDLLNSWLFVLRYGRKVIDVNLEIRPERLDLRDSGLELRVVPINEIATEKLVEFFAKQPEEAFKYFNPHGFDAKSIKKLQRNKAFLGYVLLEIRDGSLELRDLSLENGDCRIAGYCFIRAFFHGKGFRGRMVSIDFRGMGLGTYMNKILNKVGFGIGLRLFETVSKDNTASYRSALSASKVKILKELPENELYLEILASL